MKKYIAVLLLAFSGSVFAEADYDTWIAETKVDPFTDEKSYTATVKGSEFKGLEFSLYMLRITSFDDPEMKIKDGLPAHFRVRFYGGNIPRIEAGKREIRLRVDKNDAQNILVEIDKFAVDGANPVEVILVESILGEGILGEGIQVDATGFFTCDLISELGSGDMLIFELGKILKLPLKRSRIALMHAAPKCFDPDDIEKAKIAEQLRESEGKVKRKEEELKTRLQAEEDQQRLGSLRDKYILAIKQKVERNWKKPLEGGKIPVCEVTVVQGPGGIILDVKFGACGGTTTYRASIENAIYKAEPLPKPSDPALFERELTFLFNPEQQ